MTIFMMLACDRRGSPGSHGDLIDVSASGFADFAELSARISDDGTDTVIDLDGTPDANDQITLLSVTNLGETNFLLV